MTIVHTLLSITIHHVDYHLCYLDLMQVNIEKSELDRSVRTVWPGTNHLFSLVYNKKMPWDRIVKVGQNWSVRPVELRTSWTRFFCYLTQNMCFSLLLKHALHLLFFFSWKATSESFYFSGKMTSLQVPSLKKKKKKSSSIKIK